MKKLIFSLLSCMLLGLSVASAQTQKVAYVVEDSILQALPEYKTQQKYIESYAKQYNSQIEAKKQQLQQEYQFLIQNQQNLSPQVLEEKSASFRKLQQEIQDMNIKAQEGVAKKNQELMKPLFDKITKGIELAAQEGGYSVVVSKGAFLYSNEAQDITKKVVAKVKAMK